MRVNYLGSYFLKLTTIFKVYIELKDKNLFYDYLYYKNYIFQNNWFALNVNLTSLNKFPFILICKINVF